jgi:group I intron endonuclease
MARVNTTCGIYMIRNKVNGRVYIGSSSKIENRIYLHKWELNRNDHHSPLLQRAWNKYGESAFEFSTVLIASVENLVMYEQLIIDFYDASNPKTGFNICKIAGRPPVVEYTQEMRKAISERAKGKSLYKNNPERYALLLERAKARSGVNHHTYGKPMSDETKRKISESKRGKSNANKGKPSPFKGISRDEEVVNKIIQTKRSKPCPYAKITEDQVIAIRNMKCETGLSNAKIGEIYGLTSSSVQSIVTFKNWKHVGGGLF